MKTENITIESLKPYQRNARKHSPEQIERIKKSVEQFGFNQPIVADEQNIIIVGHGRYEAAKLLGLKFVPVIIKKDLSEEQKKAYRILDNKLQNDSEWDYENLELELKSLIDLDYDIKTWGLETFIAPDFEPGSEDEQGKLDKLDPKLVKCPECAHIFNSRDNDVKA